MAKTGVIYGINGPVVSLAGDPGFQMNEMVYVGKENLVGEVIGLTSEKTTIQVYEETSGLKPGEVVTGTGAPVSVTLAPGILDNIGAFKQDRRAQRLLYQPWHQRRFSGYLQKMENTYDSKERRPGASGNYHRRSSGNQSHCP